MAGTVVADALQSRDLNPPVFQNSSGIPIGSLCRAWVTFAGGTGTISAGFNVSSVAKIGTGLYTITFTNSMPDSSYSICGFSRNNVNTMRIAVCATSQALTWSNSQVSITVGEYANNVDSTAVSVSFFR